MSLYGVHGAPTKTDCQVIHEQCSEDVPGNTWWQLIDLQSKACHSKDTTSCNTFLWVDFVSEYGFNFDSDSAVPDISWHNNRKSTSEANPVKVTNDAILSGYFMGIFQVKEMPTACCLCARASWRYLSGLTRWSVVLRCFLKPHWLLSSILRFSRYQMKRVFIMGSRTVHRQLVSAMDRN